MALNRFGTVSAPLTIISTDLEADPTFTADAAPGAGVLRAGTLMAYDPVTMTLRRAVIGTDPFFGILADDIDTGPVGITEVQPALVYRKGVFLRQEIANINNVTIAPGSPLDLALNDLGLFLEFGHEDDE